MTMAPLCVRLRRAALAPAGCALVSAVSLCCSAPGPAIAETPRLEAPTLASWRESRARLAELHRAAAVARPTTLRVALLLRERRTGRVLEARGAVALGPPDALRMVLLGPGGTTAVDLWASGDSYRLAVPAADLLARGDARTDARTRGRLPVDFLRWWLLDPTRGALLWHERRNEADMFVLRDESGAIVRIEALRDGRVRAVRARPGGLEERVEAERFGCAPVRYESDAGIEVAVQCEGVEPRPPRPEAFVDPDARRTEAP